MNSALSVITFGIGSVSFVVSIIIALANRGIREERIDHLSGMVEELRADLDHERGDCARKLQNLSDKVSHQQGQIDAATGEIGERIGREVGRSIAAEVIDRLTEVDL